MDYRASRGTIAMQFDKAKRLPGKKIKVTGTVIDAFIAKGDAVSVLDNRQLFFLGGAEIVSIKSVKKPKKLIDEASPGEAVTLLLRVNRGEEGDILGSCRVKKGFFLTKVQSR